MSAPLTGELSLASGDVLHWNTHVTRQWTRYLDAPSEYDAEMDLELLAVSVQQVLKASAYALRVAQNRGSEVATSRIEKAQETFEEAIPDGRDVRNLLEHIDAYRLGEGKKQKSGEVGDFLQWVERADDGPVLVLGARYRLPVPLAKAACDHLTAEVVAALQHIADREAS